MSQPRPKSRFLRNDKIEESWFVIPQGSAVVLLQTAKGLALMTDLRRIRILLTLFMTGLALSGITAFPLVHETDLLRRVVVHLAPQSAVAAWVDGVHAALADTAFRYPYLAYGTDWLAFAHLVLAVLFIGPWRDPVRNRWVFQFGLIACAGVLPLALIAGPIRGIPLFWRLGDCSFGVIGAIPLLIALRAVNRLEAHAAA